MRLERTAQAFSKSTYPASTESPVHEEASRHEGHILKFKLSIQIYMRMLTGLNDDTKYVPC
jgi:hypothetical protein